MGLEELGAAIKRELGSRTQTWLAERLGDDTGSVSRLVRGMLPELTVEKVRVIEEALELPRGFLLREGGYVDEQRVTVEWVVMNDPALNADSRRMLLAAYRAATAA